MSRVDFAETFYWIAVAHPRDAFHNQVVTRRRAHCHAQLVTTEEVLTEVLNWFAGWGPEARLSATDRVADLPCGFAK